MRIHPLLIVAGIGAVGLAAFAASGGGVAFSQMIGDFMVEVREAGKDKFTWTVMRGDEKIAEGEARLLTLAKLAAQNAVAQQMGA